MISNKRCAKCGEVKSGTDFNKRRASSDGLQPWCRACDSVQGRSWYKANRDRALAKKAVWNAANPDKVREAHLRRSYGTSTEMLGELRAAQNGLCWICQKPLGDNAHTDHDHSRKELHVRSLLHSKCNHLEGAIRNNPRKVGRILRLHSGEDKWPKT